jgi:hypothetical protein
MSPTTVIDTPPVTQRSSPMPSMLATDPHCGAPGSRGHVPCRRWEPCSDRLAEHADVLLGHDDSCLTCGATASALTSRDRAEAEAYIKGV